MSGSVDLPKRAQERLTRALLEHDGHMRDDGQWVDPIEFQKVLIEEGFRAAAADDEFDIWSVVDERLLRDTATLAENWENVYDAWEDQTEDVAQEVAKQLEATGHELEEDQNETGGR